MNNDLFKQLAEPFPRSDVKTRKVGGNRMADYITARHVMNRLDKVLGPANWRDEYHVIEGGVVCTLYIRIDNEWIGKTDVGTENHTEPIKSMFSDALKRAAVRWGIGRELYNDGTAWDEDDGQEPDENRTPPQKPKTALKTRDSDPAQPTTPARAETGQNAPQSSGNGADLEIALSNIAEKAFDLARSLWDRTPATMPEGINWGWKVYLKAKEELGYRDDEHVQDTLGVDSLNDWTDTLGKMLIALVENAPGKQQELPKAS